MAYLVWRFQADVRPGEIDPLVTVFFGPERSVMDDKGEPTAETFVEQSTANPILLPLSQVVMGLANPAAMEAARVVAMGESVARAGSERYTSPATAGG